MDPFREHVPARRRLPIAWKFSGLLAVLVPALIGVSWIGDRALGVIKARLDAVHDDSLATSRLVGRLSTSIEEAEELSLRLVAETDPNQIARIRIELSATVIPRVERGIAELRLAASDLSQPGDLALVERLDVAWHDFSTFTHSTRFLEASSRESTADRATSTTLERLAEPLTATIAEIDATEQRQALAARRAADSTYARSVYELRVIAAIGLLVGVGATLLLSRNVVRRIRAYSTFAKHVAAGDLDTRTRPTGHDELTDLGWALNTMVTRGQEARAYEETQAEFTDALQVTGGEEEAYGLLKRHIERSIPGTDVVTLNRNNSADRLEPTTPLSPDSGLMNAFAEAHPRDCLAVRLARSHHGDPASEPLIGCPLCGGIDRFSTCKPLLVSGEVIGSVLVTREEPLLEAESTRIGDSVAQAAPVLANLRNLAVAELRAATDQLTGLPNTRAVQDTLRRLVAQAARMILPLAAVLFDLDHFKRINDRHGHPKGDEVLASVGATLQATLRDSDFVGRYGGEEFIMILPATGREAAVQVAERVREAIANIEVLDEENVTASFGVAVFPDDASDAVQLVRNADRALYRAKANGRNRVEVFSLDRRTDDVKASPQAAGVGWTTWSSDEGETSGIRTDQAD